MLIALAILGVIATFTIPKILNAQQNAQYSSIAKEAAGTISEAYLLYKQNNALSGTTTAGAFTPTLNYVKIDTTTRVDDEDGDGFWTCGVSPRCLKLHNGAMLWWWNTENFSGTNNTNAIVFSLDHDGSHKGIVDGSHASLRFFLYYNGRLTSRFNVLPNTVASSTTFNPDGTPDPPWFSWE